MTNKYDTKLDDTYGKSRPKSALMSSDNEEKMNFGSGDKEKERPIDIAEDYSGKSPKIRGVSPTEN